MLNLTLKLQWVETPLQKSQNFAVEWDVFLQLSLSLSPLFVARPEQPIGTLSLSEMNCDWPTSPLTARFSIAW